jgi:serine protease Do
VEGRDVSFIGSDALTDLAVLKVRKKNIRPISWGNSRAERPGNWVMILASPLDFDFSVSQGVISGMNRQVGSKVPIEDLIQTTAMINPGSSGGAMINLNGELIGIIMAMATRSDAWQGLGFAIPEKIARPVARSIIDHGYVKRGFLGINMEAITRFRARARQLPEVDGVLIEDVLEGYPAQRADLKSGDIIIAINNRPVTTPKDIFREIGTRFKNDTVKLTVMRPDGQLNLRIKLAESPPNKRIAEMLDPDAMERRRERMSEPGNVLPQPDETEEAWRNQPDLLKKLGMTVVPRLDAEDGLMVLAVRTDSPAAEAKLQVGDVLMRVGQTTVSGMVQLRRALLRQEGIAAPIFVIRAGEGKELLLPLTDLD